MKIVRGNKRERGASLVEFAILAPFLLLLLFGIIEFGWLFGQYNDVRHGAREGARFAAVNAGDNTAVRDSVCSAMEGLTAGMTSIAVSFTDPGTVGAQGDIVVIAQVSSLSGVPLISSFLPSQLSSTVSFRLEQPSSLWSSAGPLLCP